MGWVSLYPKHSMLLQQYQVSHSQFVWDIFRQNQKLSIILKFGLKTGRSLTSFDGHPGHFPPEETIEDGIVKLGITQIKVILDQILNVFRVG